MGKTVRKEFPVTGLSCASCAISVESMLKEQKGVTNASVNYANSSAQVEFEPAIVQSEDLKAIIQSIGYDLLIEDDGAEQQEGQQQEHTKKLKTNTIWASVLALPIVVISMFMMDLSYGNWIMMALAAPVVGWFGHSFFVNAWNQAKHGKANMDTLVALSTGIAFIFSAFNTILPQFLHKHGQHPPVYFEASAVVIAFILLGKLLEERAKSNTSSALKKLIGLQPSIVNVVGEDGQIVEMQISQVRIGDKLLVKPGDKIPVDGEIISGSSFIDESTITGESLPVEKEKAGLVFAGTINQKGSFVFVAQKVGGDTILARIIKMVQQAQGSKPPVQKLVDKIAGIFVPVVMTISSVTFGIWMIVGGENAITQALLAMVSVLVIACPCALGLATPTAIMVGIGKGAENGILIKDAESLELAHMVNAIVLDKTGTITEGRPAVTDVFWNTEGEERAGLEQILYSIESQSEHPLAEAVIQSLRIFAFQGSATGGWQLAACIENPLQTESLQVDATGGGQLAACIENPLQTESLQVDATGGGQLAAGETIPIQNNTRQMIVPDQFESITGKGVVAKYNQQVYFVGNQKLLAEHQVGISPSDLERINLWQDEAKTVICFACDKEIIATFAIADQIKETSAQAIKELQNQGIEVFMLTGDTIQTAKAVANKVGLVHFKAEVMPSDKAEFIIGLQKQGKIVAMVGDGINDSHALAQADVSIAMGKGSDIAMDVAKMTIISSDLRLISKAVRLSKLTVGTIQQNLFWAFIYNVIGIPVAAGILYPIWGFMLNPMIAGAAMALSSVSVVSNSLRLKGKRL